MVEDAQMLMIGDVLDRRGDASLIMPCAYQQELGLVRSGDLRSSSQERITCGFCGIQWDRMWVHYSSITDPKLARLRNNDNTSDVLNDIETITRT